MRLSVIFSDFQPITLSPPIAQSKAIEVLSQTLMQTVSANPQEVEEYLHKYAVKEQYIKQRELNAVNTPASSSKLSNFISPLEYLPNPVEQPRGLGLSRRMEYYDDIAAKAIELAYSQPSIVPDDLVHVSCSGYTAPSVAEKLVAAKGWGTTVTHSYHMGCYGAFPALRIATGLIAASHACLPQPKSQVDIVHTEYLSLHLNSGALSANNIINATLFGDGFIKYSAYPDMVFPEKKSGLKLLALSEVLLPDSSGEMVWNPGDYHFEMFLSRYVPIHIRKSIYPFIEQLCKQANIDLEAEKESLYFAIHPGGPGILNHIQKKLGIEDRQMDLSWNVLEEHGNMSSATVPYLWKSIVESERFDKGQRVVSMAFGPGLTASGAVMEKV